MKFFRSILAAAAIVVAVGATTGRADIPIAVVGPMTGQYAAFGAQMKAGAEQAVGSPLDSFAQNLNAQALAGKGFVVLRYDKRASGPHAQENVLQGIARGLGFDGLDALLEQGTGRPVGPTVKGGKRAAAGGLSPDEEERRLRAFGPTPPTLGSGLNGMMRANPDTGFVTGSAPGAARCRTSAA